MPSDEDILCATWRALCKQGYADLTMQDIADETDKSKAALHYHYDSKADLLEAFLGYVADCFLSRVREADAAASADPVERLSVVLDAALSPPEENDREDMQRALLELKAQAPHEPAFRDRIREADAAFRALLVDILTAGIESGDFRADLDPGETARFVINTLAGAQLRSVSVGQDRETARRLLETYVEERVYARRGAPAE